MTNEYSKIKKVLVNFRKKNNLSNTFINHKNKKIDINWLERFEQYDIIKYLPKDSIVLELGARFGTVSCIINKIINNPFNQVSVEPDERVWEALEYNKKNNNCSFNIFKGAISEKRKKLDNINETDGYGATSVNINNYEEFDSENEINIISFCNLEKKFALKFNVLVVDCEGCLGELLNDNLHIYKQINLIFFEKDYPKKTNYQKIEMNLIKNGFVSIKKGNLHKIFKKI